MFTYSVALSCFAQIACRLNGFIETMVRAVGIEPTLLAELDFESSASTNSTTPAHLAQLSQLRHALTYTQFGASSD